MRRHALTARKPQRRSQLELAGRVLAGLVAAFRSSAWMGRPPERVRRLSGGGHYQCKCVTLCSRPLSSADERSPRCLPRGDRAGSRRSPLRRCPRT